MLERSHIIIILSSRQCDQAVYSVLVRRWSGHYQERAGWTLNVLSSMVRPLEPAGVPRPVVR